MKLFNESLRESSFYTNRLQNVWCKTFLVQSAIYINSHLKVIDAAVNEKPGYILSYIKSGLYYLCGIVIVLCKIKHHMKQNYLFTKIK